MVDALVRLGGTLRLYDGVLELFGGPDLLACSPCLRIVSLLNTILGRLTFVAFSRTTTSTLEATSLCSRRRLPSRQSMPSTFGELMLDLSRRRRSLVQASPTATTSETTKYHAHYSRLGQ
jgi:hypothetical protein